jgi:hypothetical protein
VTATTIDQIEQSGASKCQTKITGELNLSQRQAAFSIGIAAQPTSMRAKQTFPAKILIQLFIAFAPR